MGVRSVAEGVGAEVRSAAEGVGEEVRYRVDSAGEDAVQTQKNYGYSQVYIGEVADFS